jgi:hypothetical protein
MEFFGKFFLLLLGKQSGEENNFERNKKKI